MFDLPEAKRVKRSELFSAFSSPSASELEDEDEKPQDIRLSSSKRKQTFSQHSQNVSNHRLDGDIRSNDLQESNVQIDYGFEYDFIDKFEPPVSKQQPPKSRSSPLQSKKLARNASGIDDKNAKRDEEDSESEGEGEGESESESESDTTNSDQDIEMRDHDKSESNIDQHNQTAQSHSETRAEQTYEFMLFKPTPSTNPSLQPDIKHESSTSSSTRHKNKNSSIATVATKQTITIRSPTPDAQPVSLLHGAALSGKFVRPRPMTHYLTSSLTSAIQTRRKTEYADAAVSGAQVLRSSTHVWYGARLPWRVIAFPASRVFTPATGSRREILKPIEVAVHGSSELESAEAAAHGGLKESPEERSRSQARRRTRPSKKKRMVVRRQRDARAQAKRVETEMVALAEAAEREKRTRRNREKKVKKKEKEKLKKAEAHAAALAVAAEPLTETVST